MGRHHVVNHNHIPAACFTHPEIAFVGLSEEQVKAKATQEGFQFGKSIGHFRANSKALAENEGDGIAKVLDLLFAFNLQHQCNLVVLNYFFMLAIGAVQ